MVEFTSGDLYEFEGLPGQPDWDGRSDVGVIVKVTGITLDGRLLIATGRPIAGGALADIAFADERFVPVSDAVAMVKRGIWIQVGAV